MKWFLPLPVSSILLSLSVLSVSPVSANTTPNTTSGIEFVRLVGHHNAINALSVSPDGNVLATASRDNSIKLWYLKDGTLIRTIRAPANFEYNTNNVESIEFSRDGGNVIVGSQDGMLYLWNAEKGEIIRVLKGHRGVVYSVKFIRDSQMAVSGGEDHTVRLWEVPTGKPIKVLRGHKTAVTSLAVSHDGRLALSASEDSLRLWDLEKRTLVRVLSDGSHGSKAVALSRDGKTAVSGGNAGATLTLWDTSTRKPLRRLSGESMLTLPSGEEFEVETHSVEFSPDGNFVAAGTTGGLAVWDLKTGEELVHLKGTPVSPVIDAVSFTKDSKTIVTGGEDGLVRIYDLTLGRFMQVIGDGPSGINSVRFSPNGKNILMGGADGHLQMWTLHDGTLTKDICVSGETNDLPRSTPSSISGLAYSRRKDEVLVASTLQLSLWNLNSEAPVKLYQRVFDRYGNQVTPDESNFNAVSISPDGRTAIFRTEAAFYLYDVKSGNMLRQFTKKGLVYLPSYFDQGRAIVAAEMESSGRTENNFIVFWDTLSGTRQKQLYIGNKRITSLAPLHNNKVLFGTEDGILGYLDSHNGHLLGKFVGHTAPVRRIGISPDGRRIVTAGDDENIALWDLSDILYLARTIRSPNGVVNSIAFSPNGQIFMTGDEYGTVTIRDANSGDIVAILVPPPHRGSGETGSDCRINAIARKESSAYKPHFTGTGGLVADMKGMFETETFDNITQFSWVADDDPYRPLHPEIFMRDYYEPRLLPRLLACREAEARGDDPDACKKAFNPVRPLVELNRIQPKVRIMSVRRGASADEALVDVEAGGKEDPTQENGKTKTAVYDLRLFRNGQIVGEWPEPRGGMSGGEDIAAWRHDSRVPRADEKTKARHPFKVQLASRDKGKPVQFTAYAFNEDRVKSETATDESYVVPNDIVPAKPRAYVVTIGVNAYQNPKWRLGFAVKDARDLSAALQRIEGYDVVPVSLASAEEGGSKLDQATKADIKDVLALLAGKDEAHRDRLRRQIGSVADRLKKVTPDDLVILGFSGHGYTDPQARFYLLPSDSGTESTITDAVLPKFISSDELSQWLRKVDAGEIVMLIDACHSAASVPEGFKPGPMGDRGLGQLAYDKGMQILAATQADNVALESEKLGQGLLTYALVQDGLKARKAAPLNGGPITIKAWLHYAEKRVPELYDEIQFGKLRLVGFDPDKDTGHRLAPKDPIIDPAFYNDIAQHAQTPALFDFYKQTADPIVETP